MDWQPIETAPKDREILLFGSDGYGREIMQYGSWQMEMCDNWETVVSSSDEFHKVNRRKEYWYWQCEKEIYPTHWCDLKRPPL